MDLKVVRYKNYGCMMESEENADPYSNRFFWSFFELNNGKIVELHLVENLENKKIKDIAYEFFYTKRELKTGRTHEYKFGTSKPNTTEFSNEFFCWFDSLPPFKDLKDSIKWPSDDEEKCVKDFFDKNIFKTRTVATNIVGLRT